MPNKPLTDSQVYVRAAEFIDAGLNMGCCPALVSALMGYAGEDEHGAIAMFFGRTLSGPELRRYVKLRNRMKGLFYPHPPEELAGSMSYWLDGLGDSYEERQHARVIVLLFMSEIAKSEDWDETLSD